MHTYKHTETRTHIYMHTHIHTHMNQYAFLSIYVDFLKVTSEYFLDLISHYRKPLGASFSLDADELRGPTPVKRS